MKKIGLGQAISILASLGVIAGIVFLAIGAACSTGAPIDAAQTERTSSSFSGRASAEASMHRYGAKSSPEGSRGLRAVEHRRHPGCLSSIELEIKDRQGVVIFPCRDIRAVATATISA